MADETAVADVSTASETETVAAGESPKEGDVVEKDVHETPDVQTEEEKGQPGDKPEALSPDMIADAEVLGFSADELAALPKGMAQKILGLFDSRVLEMGKGPAAETGKAGVGAVKPETVAAPGAERAKPAGEEVEEEIKVALNAEDYEPAIRDAFNTLVEVANKTRTELREMQAALGHTIGVQQEREREVYCNWFDSQLAGLPDAQRELFGTEPRSRADMESPQWKNRIKLLETMETLAKGYERLGRSVPDDATLLKKALAMEFSENAMEAARKELRAKVVQRGGRSIARPTHREASAGTPEERAIQYANRVFKENAVD